MRPSSTSCATSSRRKSRTPGRSDSGTSVSRTRRPTPVDGFTWGNPRRYVYRKAASSSEMVQSLNDQTTVSCPVCGHYNDADATVCGACAFALGHLAPEEKVDAILEDLLDLSKAPMAEEKPVSSPTPEEPDVDEVTAEQLFDSLLIEIQPSPAEEAAEDRALSEEVAETPPAREASADAVPIPVLATPAETEGRKMIRISGRMFDGVTYASVGALVAVFIFFRVSAIPFDPENEVEWCNLGTVYFKKDLLAKALDCYDKAIHIRPKYAIAWNNKGVVYARMNRFADADKCHTKATKLRPEYVAAWLNRGEVLTRLGARDEAQKCLERARSISRTAAA